MTWKLTATGTYTWNHGDVEVTVERVGHGKYAFQLSIPEQCGWVKAIGVKAAQAEALRLVRAKCLEIAQACEEEG